jgi:hypothetical protein
MVKNLIRGVIRVIVERIMSITRIILLLFSGLLLSMLLPPLYAQQDKAQKPPAVEKAVSPLVGVWEITQTKEPGKPYMRSYKGHPFGNELRHTRNGSHEDEVMYVRFDSPNQYTSTEVYEGTPDPGLFAQFRRIE